VAFGGEHALQVRSIAFAARLRQRAPSEPGRGSVVTCVGQGAHSQHRRLERELAARKLRGVLVQQAESLCASSCLEGGADAIQLFDLRDQRVCRGGR
jgi:hypothetical protein